MVYSVIDPGTAASPLRGLRNWILHLGDDSRQAVWNVRTVAVPPGLSPRDSPDADTILYHCIEYLGTHLTIR